MYPPTIARTRPHAPAYIMAGSGLSLTYGQLDERSNQLAHACRDLGVRDGDSVMIVMENRLEWPVIVAAGMRSGMYVTPVNWHLKAAELAALVSEAKPKVLVTSPSLASTVGEALCDLPGVLICVGGAPEGFVDFDQLLADKPTTPIDGERIGARVLYSGGTTGRPRAFRQALLDVHPAEAPARHGELMKRLGIDGSTVLLSPAPNYHAAPFTFQLITLGLGGTVVCMERFDPLECLSAIARYEVTHSQWVPTMLVRLLDLHAKNANIALSASHKVAVTSGAPCPPDVKAALDGWWGPLLHEYYGASEGYGHTYISPLEARTHRGSVGRPLGATAVHITDEAGTELAPGEIGQVSFEALQAKAYVNQGESGSSNRKGMGDLGYLDEEGFLYLTGRAGYTIISGGVNIYPDEIEAALLGHPSVLDAAVFGEYDPDFGERVVAVVELAEGTEQGDAIVDSLVEHCRDSLASFKQPRRVVITEEMPRLPTGKLNKKLLRDTYAQQEHSTANTPGDRR